MMFLCGCQVHSDKIGTALYNEEFSKAQEIIIIPANTFSIIQKLTKEEEISHFIEILDIEHWELKTLPKGTELMGTFEFSQKKQLNLENVQQIENCILFVKYVVIKEIPYITLEMVGCEMTFEVPNTTMEYLTEYFVFKNELLILK